MVWTFMEAYKWSPAEFCKIEDKVQEACDPNAEVKWVHCAHVGAALLNLEQMSLKKGANFKLDATQPTSLMPFIFRQAIEP